MDKKQLIETLIYQLCIDYNIDANLIKEKRRFKDVIYFKSILALIIFYNFKISLKEIAELLNINYATIIHYKKKCFNELRYKDFQKQLNDMKIIVQKILVAYDCNTLITDCNFIIEKKELRHFGKLIELNHILANKFKLNVFFQYREC